MGECGDSLANPITNYSLRKSENTKRSAQCAPPRFVNRVAPAFTRESSASASSASRWFVSGSAPENASRPTPRFSAGNNPRRSLRNILTPFQVAEHRPMNVIPNPFRGEGPAFAFAFVGALLAAPFASPHRHPFHTLCPMKFPPIHATVTRGMVKHEKLAPQSEASLGDRTKPAKPLEKALAFNSARHGSEE